MKEEEKRIVLDKAKVLMKDQMNSLQFFDKFFITIDSCNFFKEKKQFFTSKN
jgi:hypothetical protein